MTCVMQHQWKINCSNKTSTSWLQIQPKHLLHAEQQLLLPDGLPRRSWYMHSLYAPGFYTGYGVKTLPGVREAIEQRNWKEAQDEINLTAQAIQRLSGYLQNIGR